MNVKEPGFSAIEMLLVVTVIAILAGTAIPLAFGSIDRARASGAASYMVGRMATARFEAVKRSAYVAIRFVEDSSGYWLTTYVDGNGDGVRTSDITGGVDRPITTAERLDFHFPGVAFGIYPDVTGLDEGQPFVASDPIQIGSSGLLSFNPTGSCTSGTVFIRGQQRTQFAVRVLGVTGRTRIFRFDFAARKWHLQ
jgi:prepilin-type N-terminal cleavage/methylation domain-containing protein